MAYSLVDPQPSGGKLPSLVHVELAALRAIRRYSAHSVVVDGARGLSHFGEHAAGWIALGLVGAAVDRTHRREWLATSVGAIGAHAAGVAVKRVVRRTRPLSDDLPPLARTPSRLSFPSAHACSTTAAAVAMTPMLGHRTSTGIAGAMALSRLLLGVHYPSDVAAGVAIGATVGAVTRRLLARNTPADGGPADIGRRA
ncbi:MAG TPA: phosphatase PAP2 family protein [Micromonosporaceae bacterium]